MAAKVEVKSNRKTKGRDTGGHNKGFYVFSYGDNGETKTYTSPSVQQMNCSSVSALYEFNIEFAQFCHEPLRNWLLDAALTAVKILELLVRLPTKLVEFGNWMDGKEVEEKIPGVPSGHHRFIRFRTNKFLAGEQVWGTVERLDEEIVCALYSNRKESTRTGARVTLRGIMPVGSNWLEMEVPSKNLGEIFHNIGGCWKGPYHLAKNNCIHYALECWNQIGGKAAWTDVCDGNDSLLIYVENDPGGRKI